MDKLRMFQSERYHLYAFLVLILAATFLWVWRLNYVTLWSDEFTGTLTLIHLSWRDLLSGNYIWEFNPPLYFLVLKAWVRILNKDTESTMRMLSILMSAGSVLASYFLGKRLGNWQVGVALMSIVAFHPIYLNYSTQLRTYPLLILLGTLALLFYSNYTFGDNHRYLWLLGLGITLVSAIYTHYFGTLLTLIIFLLSTFFLIVRRDRRQYPVLLTILASILFSLPISKIFLQQYSNYVQRASSLPTEFPPLSIKALLAMLSGSMSFDFSVAEPAHILALLAVVGGLIVLFRNGKGIIAIALTLAICIPSLIVIAISARNINISPRYLIQVSFLAWIIASLSLIRTNDNISKLLQIFVIMAIGINGLNGIIRTLNREYPAPNWKNVAEILVQDAHPDEQIVIMGWDASPTAYYLGRKWLTSYDLEDQYLSKETANSYLILDSKQARKLNFIDYTQVIYEDSDWQVRIIRYIPEGIETPPGEN